LCKFTNQLIKVIKYSQTLENWGTEALKRNSSTKAIRYFKKVKKEKYVKLLQSYTWICFIIVHLYYKYSVSDHVFIIVHLYYKYSVSDHVFIIVHLYYK